VEYPKMDRDLHLLMLMHRQVEEARGLGVEEPRLEYREEPAMLTVRVAGVDAVEEVGYGGMRTPEGATSEQPGVALRRLGERGYARLTPGEVGTGTVEITDEGLKKLRQRRAFEANLRRRLTMPEVFLIGGPRVGVMNLWRVDWEGHVIRVRDRRYVGRSTNEPATEYLEIDARLAHVGMRSLPEIEPLPGYMHLSQGPRSKDLYGELRAADGTHEVHAHIGLLAPFRRVGCLISVDGVVVGGDVGKRFLT
jgi:hypothetical protein